MGPDLAKNDFPLSYYALMDAVEIGVWPSGEKSVFIYLGPVEKGSRGAGFGKGHFCGLTKRGSSCIPIDQCNVDSPY